MHSFDDTRHHVVLHERDEKAAHAIAVDDRQEIRMIAALVALTGFDDWAPELLADTPAGVLQAELGAAIHDILGQP